MGWKGARMTTPYSQDLRHRVLAAYDRGMKTKQISVIFDVSSSWARRVKQRRRETGETTHRPMGAPIVFKVDRARLAELVREHPDATLAELRELLGVECVLSTLSGALKDLGLSFKKKRSTQRSRIVRTLSNDGPSGVHGRRMSMPVA
jgi:transposase